MLALSEMQMDPKQQAELSELLARNREGLLEEEERIRLDELMQVYRRGLVRKAQALKVAVERGAETLYEYPDALTVRSYWVLAGWHPPEAK